MNDKIFKTINKYNLLSKNDTVLIGLSGGADSVFLAEFLLSIRNEYNLTLKAAHIEHGIRGEESLSDCRFVERFCEENNIECFTLHIHAAEEAKAVGLGVEEYSRNRRYEFFNSIECDKIATAHNLTDNIETLLFRLARGTSIKGLCGIPAVRGKIIRPLLSISGKEIRDYLNSNHIKYCVDSTNSSGDYSRNHIRNNILPLFGQLNNEYENMFLRFIESVNEDSEFIENSANQAMSSVYDGKTLDIEELKKYPVAIRKRIIINYFSFYNLKLNEFHLSEILKLLYKPSKTQISGNIYALSNKKSLRIADVVNIAKNVSYISETEILSAADFLNKCELCGKKFDFYCDCDKIVGNIIVRSREEGDKISPANRGCTKTLKKLFNELEIPVEARSQIPVLTDDNGIIGIYGYCVDERVKTDESTKNILIINVSAEDNT